MPTEQDIEIFQGDPHSIRLTFSPAVDVSARTFACQLRARRDPDATLLASYTADMSNAATGVVTLILSADDSANLRRDCFYDVEQIVAGVPTTLFYGQATVTRQVTTP